MNKTVMLENYKTKIHIFTNAEKNNSVFLKKYIQIVICIFNSSSTLLIKALLIILSKKIRCHNLTVTSSSTFSIPKPNAPRQVILI